MRIVEHKHELYLKAGQHCIHDIPCGILRRATPEEFVRQDVLHTLHKLYGWPYDMMLPEFNLFRYGGHGRIDLLLILPGEEENQAFAVVECKAPQVSIDRICLDQACRYADKLNASYIVLTNRTETFVMYTEDGESWDYVDDLPDFEQVCQDPNIAPQILAPLPPFQRPKWTDLNNPASLRNLAESRPDVISPHTDSRLWRPILDLEGILHDESESPSLPWDSHRYRMAEDWGVPYLSLGNLSGGTWSGPYRNLLTYDPVGDPHTIGFMVSASSELINDPRSGNSPSKAYLIVVVLEDRRTHISLELNLHEHMRRTRQGWELWHNGRLTAGRFGSMTRARVRQFVASHASDLVVDNEIKLGTLPADRQLTWTDLQDPLLRLARYALIRDQFRSELT